VASTALLHLTRSACTRQAKLRKNVCRHIRQSLMAPGCAQHNADYLINQSLAGQAFFAKKIKKR
ncbi:hypothetical protein, partial [Lacticaseibacillus nasuensis]|uniref:hypothetical protein n=1 Tax=Lacticaseibacillus nasuensis TaxID=944671 RepID=UPI001CDAF84D